IEEVRVVSNNFSATEGRSSGARIQMISKSGTNAVHGGVSHYFQNNTLASRNVFESKGVSVFRRNQFGYFVGGPVKRNRTFFFTSYEGLRMSGARSAVITVETPAFRDWVKQALPNSIAAKVFTDFPAIAIPTSSFVSLPTNAALVNPPAGLQAYGAATFTPDSYRNGDQFSVRLDHEIRPGKDKFFGNFYRTRNTSLDGNSRPGFNRERFEHALFWSTNETHIFSSNKINEFKFGTMRYEGGRPPALPHPEIPLLTVSPIASFGDNAFPSAWWQYGLNYKDTFSWIKNSHSLKFGGEIRRDPTENINTSNYVPSYTFNDVLSFVNDKPLQMTRLVDPVTGTPTTQSQRLRRHEMALFAQDDWKVNPNLTVNVGLRYENYAPATDGDGHLNGLVLGKGANLSERLVDASAQFLDRPHRPDNNNFAPRFGFAWNPGGRGKMSIRGGYGVTFDRPSSYGGWGSNPPLLATVTLGAQFGNTFTYSLGDPSKPYLGYPVDASLRKGLDSHNGILGIRVNTSTFDPNYATAYVHNWFFGVQREVRPGWIIEGDYIGSAGHKLYSSVNVNRYAGDLLDGTFSGYNPSFSAINWNQSTGNSIYNAGTLHLRHPFSRGATFEAVYTMGKAIGDSDGGFQDVNNRRAERAAASFDVARRASFLGVWEIPFLKAKKGPVGAIFGGWQLSGTMVMQSGQPFNITHGASYPRGDFNADGTGGDRPDSPAASLKRDDYGTASYLTGIFKASDFPVPTPGTNGNLGRNVFRGPGYIQTDAALSKKLAITERISMNLRIDGYNLPNRTNLLEPVGDLNSNSFGKSTDTLPAKAYQAGVRVTF
ncbi:MAG: Cna domain protein, partial [Bryobacterales bacterium]|nr:Cna domain protein [Bryobacterales bacterium]